MRLQHFIDRLESFAAARGVVVCRTALCPWVLGRLQDQRMILRSGLSKEQQLLTLIHELAHLLAHSDGRLNRTVCEYEAEAVERLVAGQLGLKDSARTPIDVSTVTDDLLACSVVRVRKVSGTLLAAARGAPTRLQAQAAIEI
jgi:IrrE N-terminal-like domain